jgi:hypothetical protein
MGREKFSYKVANPCIPTKNKCCVSKEFCGILIAE